MFVSRLGLMGIAIIILGISSCRLRPNGSAASTDPQTKLAVLDACQVHGGYGTEVMLDYRSNIAPHIINKSCAGCHVAGGLAAEHGSRFQIHNDDLPQTFDWILESSGGIPLSESPFLAKPSGYFAHHNMDEPLIDADSQEYAHLKSFNELLLANREGVDECRSEELDCFKGTSLPVLVDEFSELFTSTLEPSCVGCHVSGGTAYSEGAGFILSPSLVPAVMLDNLKAFVKFINFETAEKSKILLKAAVKTTHSTLKQPVLDEGSQQFKDLESFVKKLQSVSSLRCYQEDGLAAKQLALTDLSLEQFSMRSDVESLHRMSVLFAARPPTDEQVSAVREKGKDELIVILEEIMNEGYFREVIKSAYNDYFNIRKFAKLLDLSSDDRASNPELMSMGTALNKVPQFTQAGTHDEDLREAIDGILHLIDYIVAEERPISEILTADYKVYTQPSARFWGVKHQGVSLYEKIGVSHQPQAGVLTDFFFLNRYPSTQTNVNRHRASKFMLKFLGIDGEAIAARATIEEGDGDGFEIATRDDPSCYICHRVMDPIASAFQHWGQAVGENGYRNGIFHESGEDSGGLATGFRRQRWQGEPAKIEWLAQQAVTDPRFPKTMVKAVLRHVFGWTIKDPHKDRTKSELHAMIYAFQDRMVDEFTGVLKAEQMSVKALIRYVVASPYFAISGFKDDLYQRLSQEKVKLGLSTRLTGETMNRLIEALFGVKWDIFPDKDVSYGAADHIESTERVPDINQSISAINMALSEGVCGLPTSTLNGLFPQNLEFDLLTTPITEENRGQIASAIKHLHYQLLGEDIPLDHEDIALEFSFLEELENRKSWECGEGPARFRHTAWAALVSYLVSDVRFIVR